VVKIKLSWSKFSDWLAYLVDMPLTTVGKEKKFA